MGSKMCEKWRGLSNPRKFKKKITVFFAVRGILSVFLFWILRFRVSVLFKNTTNHMILMWTFIDYRFWWIWFQVRQTLILITTSIPEHWVDYLLTYGIPSRLCLAYAQLSIPDPLSESVSWPLLLFLYKQIWIGR